MVKGKDRQNKKSGLISHSLKQEANRPIPLLTTGERPVWFNKFLKLKLQNPAITEKMA